MAPLPPTLPVMVPLPLVGVDEMEYVEFTLTPELAPLGAPISSLPAMLPAGLAPFAVNSPERIVTPSVAGTVVNPAYVPFTALLVKGVVACGSPNPNNRVLLIFSPGWAPRTGQ